ncbi:MAG: hypothetical protein IJ661_12990 [Lachnospiraceae bacterium]|nr:hypothetical protein [Lachnospiraceae bacterium]
MGKRNNGLGKLIAFTTAVAAIGGIFYIFRDKIKESSIYKTASDKAEDIYGSVKEKINKDEDFFFDDWDDDFEEFEDTASNDDNNRGTNNREYTSISSVNNDIFAHTASFNESASVPAEDIEAKASAQDSAIDLTQASTEASDVNTDSNLTEEIPTIEFNTSSYSLESIPEAYENEGLSDTSEDPDVLEDQDKLDF